jgi:UPF0755 protein
VLERARIIRDRRLFLAALWHRGGESRLQAGEYRFAGPASTFDVIEKLIRGDVHYWPVTVPEGLTLLEIASLLSQKGLGEEQELKDAFSRGELIAQWDPEATDLEGYLFPDTYRFPRRPPPLEVARAMVAGFSRNVDQTRRQRSAAAGLTLRELVTFASIVEKETGLAEERPLIASVFHNRLARGMAMQSDPTVIYDLKRRGVFDGNLKRDHLETDSPYNTYQNPGLPPGPIASPGLEAIDAVLDPASSNYLYFVARNDGSHHFSESLAEHNRAVRQYQVEFFRKKRRSGEKPSAR